MLNFTVGSIIPLMRSASVYFGFETKSEDIIVEIDTITALKKYNGFTIDSITVYNDRPCLWLCADDAINTDYIIAMLTAF